MATKQKPKRPSGARSLHAVVSFSGARFVCMAHVDRHRYLPDFVKDMAKKIIENHFKSMTEAVGLLELAVLRERQHPKS